MYVALFFNGKSNYRSALIQGKFLAKKGLWVSEYRNESGLNFGGHAFATERFLFGPILAEFRDQKDSLPSYLENLNKGAFFNNSSLCFLIKK